MLGELGVISADAIYGDTLIGFVDPNRLLVMKEAIHQHGLMENIPPHRKELYQAVDEVDNPIVVLFTLKDF